MKTNSVKSVTTAALIWVMLALPIRAEGPISASDPSQPQKSWVAVCVVAFAGLAVAGIYIVAKRCQTKYYWLMDDDEPPKFWVGTATDKQCEIEGWKKIGGPYDRPEDAPAQHPDPTNRVTRAFSEPLNMAVQSSTDGHNWTTVYTETCDMEDFGYFPTNEVSGMFRITILP